MKRSFALITMLVACLTLGACGNSGSSTTTTAAAAATPLTGYVVDAPVQGMSYTCGTLTGITGADGSFQHDAGATCTFKIGNVTLGTISTFPSNGVITPYELAGVSSTDALNPNALAIAQFLQSLDDGSKPGQLTIPASATAALSNVIPTSIVSGSTALGQSQLETLVATASNNAKTLVSAAAAGSALTSYLQTRSLIATKLAATAVQGTAPLSACPDGGITVTAGIDVNGNGVLDASEVTSTQYVCNGANGTKGATGATGASGATGAAGASGTDGLSALASIVTEAAGANCASGGKKVNVGQDTNGNGVLDAGEITSSNYVCNGATGATGVTGAAGTNGTNGTNGATGPAGPGVTWVNVTGTTQQAAANTGYLASNDVAQVTLTLPAAPVLGDIVQVSGVGMGGWKVAQNAGQSIITDNLTGHERGAVWTARDSVRNWGSVASSADGSKLVAAVQNGQLYTSTDAGVTWTARDVARAWLSVASSADGSKLVAAAYNGQLYTSTDAGVTWTARDAARMWFAVATSADGSKLVAAAYNGQLYTSTDAGVTWTARDAARTWFAVASSADGSKLVAAAYNGQLYTSTDAGVTWAARAAVANWNSVASSSDGTKLVAVVRGGRIYTSTDAGVTWTARDSARNWYSVASSADGSKLVAVVDGVGSIYTSSDSGATWAIHNVGGNWYSVTSSADGGRLVAASNGGVQLYTSSWSTMIGAIGSLSGEQYDAVDLQYVGNGTFMVRSYAGYLVVQ